MDDDSPTNFALSAEAFAEFMRVCENPPPPTPALVEAMRAHSKWRGDGGTIIIDARPNFGKHTGV